MRRFWTFRATSRLAVIATLGVCGSTQAALAQEQSAPAVTLDDIVVTGSRLARRDLDSTTPVLVLSATDIQATGQLNTADVLRNLPAVGISGVSSANSNFQTSGAGVNTINLRNLGDSRTLVLINGRRMVPGLAGESAADFNMIPTDFIERIDVITGGASAVYGSEAIAGVVNVVLKDHLDGVRLRAQGGGATEGGENTRLGSLSFGSDFADKRGTALFSVSYDKDSGLYSRQRAISTVDTSITLPGIRGALSSYNPQGTIFLPDANGNVVDGLYTFNGAGNLVPYDTSLGFNRDAYRRITVPVDRTLVSGVLNYHLSERQQLYTEFTYGQTHTQSDIEPFAIGIGAQGSTDNVYGGFGTGIPLTNAYIPQSLLAIIAADNADPTVTGNCSAGVASDCITSVDVRKRLVDVAIRSSEARRQTSRIVAGVKGDLFTTPWTYDVYYLYGRTTDDQTSTGQVNASNLRFALDSTVDASGHIVCRDPVAQAQGCVPINVFGANSITPAAAAYINALQNRNVVIQEQVMSAVATGPLWTLPAGPLRAVVGAERRTEQSSEIQDALTNAGLNGGNALPNTIGSYTVTEGFVEVGVPLLAGQPGIKDLSVESALRTSDYTTVGRVNTWNVRLNFAPIDDLRFRGAYSKAVRAPNIGELYTGPSQTFPTGIADPCDGVTASAAGAVAAACRAIPGIANAIASPGGFHYSFLDYQVITGFNSGNPNLQPETAKTYTIGAVLTPTAWRGFSATVDYFNIRVDNAVGNVDYPTLLSTCLLTGSPGSCGAVFRNPTTGKLTRVDQLAINVATISTAGVDFEARYRLDLPAAVGGALAFGLNWTYLDKLDQINQPGGPVVHSRGQIGLGGSPGQTGAPANRGTLLAEYDGHEFTIGWTVRYESAMKDQVDPGNVSPAQLPFNSVPAYTYHDFQLRYLFNAKAQTALYGGIRNVFDKKPPFLPTGMASQATGTETSPDQYDAIGRIWYAGVEVKL